MTEGLGRRIREARLARGMSLRATAAAADISPSLLSQVETGKVQPSVSTLYAIVSCLGLSIDAVLGHRPEVEPPRRRPRLGNPVQLAADAPLIEMENGVTWRGLAVMDPGDRVDALLVEYAPRAASSIDDSHMRHAGIEYGVITQGELTLKLDFDRYVLSAGDSFSFDAMRPHLYVNHTDAPAVGVWFVVGRTADSAPADPHGSMRTAVDVLEAMSRMPGRTDRDIVVRGGGRDG